jgi:hypothetical protein
LAFFSVVLLCLLASENLLSWPQDQSTAADIGGSALKLQSTSSCQFMHGWQG